MFAFLGKTGSGRQRVKPELLTRIGPQSHPTALRGELRQRLSKHQNVRRHEHASHCRRTGRSIVFFSELLFGRADCSFFPNLTAALMPSAGIILDP
jgi:hypothetical protein